MLNTDQIQAPTTNVFGLMATPAALAPCLNADQHRKPHIKAATTTVNVAIGRSTSLPVPCEFWATTDTDYDYGHGYECIYDPKRISLADAEKWVRNQLAEQGVKVARFLNADTPLDDDTRLTHKAVAVYLARLLHDQALTEDNPAKTLDDIADSLPEVFAEMGTAPDLAAVLLPEVADRVWAFAVVAHARAEVGEGYEYVFDILADNLRNGRDPQAVRDEVPRVVAKLRASRIVARIWEARDAADGPWAEILDIVLAEIEKGADPQAVLDQVLGLMAQVRAENGETTAAA